MDATGLAASTASEYFRSRTGNRCSQWVKVSVVVLCTSLLAVGLIVSLGPSNDRTQAEALLTQVQAISRPDKLYADGGYDAEWIHARCREDWGVESFIKPLNHRADGTRSGHWRRGMSPEHLRAQGYGRRWAVESFFSGLKRTMGASLNARRTDQMLAEASFRVLAYALRVRQACRSQMFSTKQNQTQRGRIREAETAVCIASRAARLGGIDGWIGFDAGAAVRGGLRDP
jgi:hypothetical protein